MVRSPADEEDPAEGIGNKLRGKRGKDPLKVHVAFQAGGSGHLLWTLLMR